MKAAAPARMLATPTVHRAPYALFTVDDAFGDERCAALEALFDADVGWSRHDDPLYRCNIFDVTDRLDASWLHGLSRRMAELTQLDLIDRARVTVQRMEPGDYIDVHSDRPLLGYEAARLVLQLDRGWTPNDGGLFRAFDSGVPVLERYPRRGAAAGMALSHASLHEVSPTRRARRSVVFNFWHRANAEGVERLVRALFQDMRFGALPDAVAELAAVADVERPERDTHRAATVAVALLAWGYEPTEAAAGYRQALNEPVSPLCELDVAVAIARWLAHLYVDDFDVAAWRTLRAQLVGLDPARYPRLRQPWDLAFAGARSSEA